MKSQAPPTGVAAFDALRWVNPPPKAEGAVLASGARLVLIRPVSPLAKSWEAEFPPSADHLLVWRRGARAPADVRIADRHDPARPDVRRNGYITPAGARSRWIGRNMVPSLALHLHLPPAWLARLAVESGLAEDAARLAPRLGLPERHLAPLFDGLLDTWREEGDPPRSALDHWVLMLGCALLPQPRARPGATLDAAALRRVQEFLRTSLHRDVGLAEMAAIPDMPARAFVAAFRAATGEAPHAHLARLRRARAEALLATTPLPPADVALLAGFRSAAHLHRALRRHPRLIAGRGGA
ncbi:helix-turn-helix domain-containing protein [Falsiroseomonas selenitidurans]|uniref:Helix-turn-helix domain-containing protein n=1 Tax=Falsiroseomonas selenitidurans TaxID=2716335 RepID=A0ABX1E9H3_9PROT|nr:helix-turn-helix domain-containing protein [Falsiroseomonas selenitidurans]NKC33874.1 helix-turn-helix domain-containing protein [Falsiroseomonas selenitidurans]